ncbi:MAG: multicopper oxidase domain-containing protein, partial [Saprospiraceae bacterium]|nr:multicopper oxidase domain-containing protein [Saprospiraceae bacterium]
MNAIKIQPVIGISLPKIIREKSMLLVGFIHVLLFIFLSNNLNAQNCPTVNVVDDPPQFQWTHHPVGPNNPEEHYSGTMEVGAVTLTMNNGETLTTRAYRQEGTNYTIPGPTIKMVPGNKYVLKLHNTLPYEPLNPSHNVFKDPNASNIHTHGLHISGESPGDDVTRVFEGERGGDFVWDIPADHMGGTYWYHAHHHGSTFLQVSGGMFGMMIVDDANDGIPTSVAGMEERQFVFGFLDPGAAGTGGDVLMSGSLSSTWTTNGVIGGNICIPPNTWQHWRVAIADRGAMLRDLSFGPECEVMLLARDGVWRTVAPKDLASNTLLLTGASRADFAIRTSSNSSIQMNGNTIANIYVDGTSDTSVHPFDVDGVSTWSANRPSYLRDLRSETNVNTESVSMGARTINGSKFDHHNPTFTLPASQVQEWSLSGNVRHPFHLHIYHVQALEDDRDFEAGEYYDVVASQMNVRFDLNETTASPYFGRTIMHCHVLSHEDRGAMGWLKVEGGQAAPTFPVDDLGAPLYSEYYLLGGPQQPPAAPGNLVATAVSSSTIDLNWDDNSSDEDGFNIEKSTDGVNFSFLASVGTDVSTYSDNGLTASTTYYYRVSAYNGGGNSAVSNTANATTLPDGGGGSAMHVSDITVTRDALNGNRFRGVATVTIVDQNGAAVSGATVNGSFSGPSSGNESGVTDASGQVSFNSRAVKNPSGDWCFEVTNVTKTGSTYDSGSNVETIDCENSGARAAANFNDIIKANPELLGAFPNPFNDHTN